jgi:peptidoglycan/LPS O-acetylase OafA/YrhL
MKMNIAATNDTACDAGGRNLTLDAWRGISVLLVVCFHAVFFRFEDIFHPVVPTPNTTETWSSAAAASTYQLVAYGGALGVKFFFVISGYIITKLLQEEHQRTGRISLPAFYVRRACRILPPLWLVIGCLYVASRQELIHMSRDSFLFALAFMCNTTTGGCYSEWFVAHIWSLSVEEQFYLAWPFMVLHLATRGVWRTALASSALFLLLAQASLLFTGELNNGLSFACIAIGALYASHPAFRELIARFATAPAMILAALALFARPLIPLYFHGQFRLHDLLTPLLICFVIFSSFEYRAAIERTIAARALAKIGLVSYGLYLWQQLFLASPGHYIHLTLLTHTYLLVPVVLVSYFVVERPFIRLGAALSKRLSRAQGAPLTPAKPA